MYDNGYLFHGVHKCIWICEWAIWNGHSPISCHFNFSFPIFIWGRHFWFHDRHNVHLHCKFASLIFHVNLKISDDVIFMAINLNRRIFGFKNPVQQRTQLTFIDNFKCSFNFMPQQQLRCFVTNSLQLVLNRSHKIWTAFLSSTR